MKDQYFGDINDYRKYGLLRALLEASELSLGVCWLRTANDGRADGEFRRYLDEPQRWRRYDADLYDALRRLTMAGVERSVLHAEEWALLPGATYYHRILTDAAQDREEYFAGAWTRLGACPVIFFDPDNGLEVDSVRYGAKDSAKYLYWREVEAAFDLGHSMVVYQHFPRKQRDSFVASIANEFAKRLGAPLVDSFRTAHVAFFLVARPEHVDQFALAHDPVLARWSRQIVPAAHLGRGDSRPLTPRISHGTMP